jgi:hypothetical protein
MRASTSKEINDRQRAGLYLLTALTKQGPTVAAALRERVGTDFAAIIVGLARALEAALNRLVAADAALVDERARDASARDGRTTWTAVLHDLLVGLRSLVMGHFVAPDLAGLGFEGRTPQEPVLLGRQADRIGVNLRAGVGVGKARFKKSRWLPDEYVEEIEEASKELRAARDRVNVERRRTDEAWVARERARDGYDVLHLETARTFESYCRMAGMEELAARVRRRTRRAKKTTGP